MKTPKVQNLRALRDAMNRSLVRLLTCDNTRLLALIRARKPDSVAEIVGLTGRAQPSLTGTLVVEP